jgi:hypothetical protein
MSFTIEKNRHIFACWASSRAAGVSPLCRFRVEDGKKILDVLFPEGKIDALKTTQDEFDEYHRNLRLKAINTGVIKMQNGDDMSHGVAAKLINLYLKIVYICGSYKDEGRINYIHPPIDSLLLDSLYDQKIGDNIDLWRSFKWSKMNSDEYQKIIDGIKNLNLLNGLWSIEEYWAGHQ